MFSCAGHVIMLCCFHVFRSIYICGPARDVPEQIRSAVRSSFVKSGKISDAEAEKLIVDMTMKGQYNVEAWS